MRAGSAPNSTAGVGARVSLGRGGGGGAGWEERSHPALPRGGPWGQPCFCRNSQVGVESGVGGGKSDGLRSSAAPEGLVVVYSKSVSSLGL